MLCCVKVCQILPLSHLPVITIIDSQLTDCQRWLCSLPTLPCFHCINCSPTRYTETNFHHKLWGEGGNISRNHKQTRILHACLPVRKQSQFFHYLLFRSARTSRTVSVRPSVELNENTNNTCIPTTALYSIILYSTIWYSTVLYGTVLCCMVQYSTAY